MDRTLAVFICQVVEEDDVDTDALGDTYGLMTVFDLNQWYHSQMPVMAKWTITDGHRLMRVYCSGGLHSHTHAHTQTLAWSGE